MDRTKIKFRSPEESFLSLGADIRSLLFVSDLDGTLLNSNSLLSAETKNLLNRAIAMGANFTIATARTPATVSSILEGVDMNLPAIVMTGATLWSPATGYSDTNFFPLSTARTLIDIFRRTGLPTFIYTMRGAKIEIFHLGPLSPQESDFMAERANSPFKHFNLNASYLKEADLEKVLLFYSIQPTENAQNTYRAIIQENPEVNALFYHDIFGPETAILEVFPQVSTKANAIMQLARNKGFKKIVAFGDNVNDIPMLRIASLPVAVENAIAQVKENADIIIPPNTDNSVAEFIYKATNFLRHG